MEELSLHIASTSLLKRLSRVRIESKQRPILARRLQWRWGNFRLPVEHIKEPSWATKQVIQRANFTVVAVTSYILPTTKPSCKKANHLPVLITENVTINGELSDKWSSIQSNQWLLGISKRYRERRSDSLETLSEGRDLIQDILNPTFPVSVFDILVQASTSDDQNPDSPSPAN